MHTAVRALLHRSSHLSFVRHIDVAVAAAVSAAWSGIHAGLRRAGIGVRSGFVSIIGVLEAGARICIHGSPSGAEFTPYSVPHKLYLPGQQQPNLLRIQVCTLAVLVVACIGHE